MKYHQVVLASLLLCAFVLAGCGVIKSFADVGVGYAEPGAVVKYRIKLASCLNAKWSTDGLMFSLNAPDGATLTSEYLTRPKNWGDTISTSGGLKAVYYTIRVSVPADAAVGTVYTGRLVGTILCPVGASGHFAFTNSSVNVNIPLELHVTSGEEVQSLAVTRFLKSVGTVAVWVGIILLVSLVVNGINKLRNR